MEIRNHFLLLILLFGLVGLSTPTIEISGVVNDQKQIEESRLFVEINNLTVRSDSRTYFNINYIDSNNNTIPDADLTVDILNIHELGYNWTIYDQIGFFNETTQRYEFVFMFWYGLNPGNFSIFVEASKSGYETKTELLFFYKIKESDIPPEISIFDFDKEEIYGPGRIPLFFHVHDDVGIRDIMYNFSVGSWSYQIYNAPPFRNGMFHNNTDIIANTSIFYTTSFPKSFAEGRDFYYANLSLTVFDIDGNVLETPLYSVKFDNVAPNITFSTESIRTEEWFEISVHIENNFPHIQEISLIILEEDGSWGDSYKNTSEIIVRLNKREYCVKTCQINVHIVAIDNNGIGKLEDFQFMILFPEEESTIPITTFIVDNYDPYPAELQLSEFISSVVDLITTGISLVVISVLMLNIGGLTAFLVKKSRRTKI